VAQLWRSKLPAIVAKHSPVDANPRHRLVAIAIAGAHDSPASKAVVREAEVMLGPQQHTDDRQDTGGARVWGKRTGHVEKSAASAQAVVTSVKVHGGEAGSGGLAYFDLDLRARFDDGSTSEFRCRVGGPFSGTQLTFAEGDIVPVRYDPQDRSKIALDEDAMNDDRASRSEAFTAARIHGAEISLEDQAAEAARIGAPTDADLQDLSDRWSAAMAKARACMDAQIEAKAAGDSKEAQRQLAAGAIANAEQVRLAEQYKRLRRQRPDWQPANT
jgi:hypothetical protein